MCASERCPRAGEYSSIPSPDRPLPARRELTFYNRSVEEATPGDVAPRILSRPEHIISRKNIDPEALKVLYRLKNHGFVAYLVGGGPRDLLLDRRPKDFDISTSAHPAQIRKLFRNSFIVGRRFRLVHVRFGRKVVETATFRKASEPEAGDTLIRRDNTFGTPEEDAFRRDFTVNALFYDIANFSVIDWVGGLAISRPGSSAPSAIPAVRLPRGPGPDAARGGPRRPARLPGSTPTPRRPSASCAGRSFEAARRGSSRSSTRSSGRASPGAPSRCSTSMACSPTSCPRRTRPSPREARLSSVAWRASTGTATPALPIPRP